MQVINDPYNGRCPSFAFEEGRQARQNNQPFIQEQTEAWKNGWNEIDDLNQPWIEHTLDKMPIDGSQYVWLKYSNGIVEGAYACQLFWRKSNNPSIPYITHYKIPSDEFVPPSLCYDGD